MYKKETEDIQKETKTKRKTKHVNDTYRAWFKHD